ncbi:Uncharacterised protein [Porphyromonas macacae]|uniref:Uncharacterized protein n=1 Tax=Porphyromonas macacae TaxID=28115 RepID=A0A379DG91_9PORP|nr:Uncharacterised protein [Porphyromonas macacae]
MKGISADWLCPILGNEKRRKQPDGFLFALIRMYKHNIIYAHAIKQLLLCVSKKEPCLWAVTGLHELDYFAEEVMNLLKQERKYCDNSADNGNAD